MVMIANDKKLQLGQFLLESGTVSQDQLDAALDFQRQCGNNLLLGEVLIKMNLCTEEQIMACLAKGYGVPFARITPKLADGAVVQLLGREFLEKHNVLPLFKVRDTLTVAISEPSNVFLIEEIVRLTDCRVQVVCATAKDIRATLETHLPNANVFVIDDIIEDIDSGDLSLVEESAEEIGDLEAAAGNSPIIKLVNYMIFSAVKEGASDIHVEPEDGALRVRFRVDGRLFEKMRPPVKMLPAIVSRIKIMARLDISERRLPQDGGIHVLMGGQPVDLRVSTLAGKFGEKVVIRIIDNRNVMMDLEKLGFSYDVLRAMRKVIEQPSGILLVTGPTGSGKSTTLYSVLQEISSDEMNICTVEDPVEFNLSGINQFQVNEKINFQFSTALRSLLRQDPDVIMIGEIRDQETARIAVQAALTGHFVFSTLHTNDAPSAITRLLNIGIEPYLLVASMEGVLAQRLVRKICNNCKEPMDPPVNVRKAVERYCGQVETLYHGAGCSKCRNTGFSGRVGIFEFLAIDDDLRDKITVAPSINELRDLAAKVGMVSLRGDGMAKVKAGITTVDEVFRATAG